MDPQGVPEAYARQTRRPTTASADRGERSRRNSAALADSPGAAAPAEQLTVELQHLPADCLDRGSVDEEMLLDTLQEYGAVDSLVLVREKFEYVATFKTAAGAAAAAKAEAEAAAAAAPAVPAEPTARRFSSAPAAMTPGAVVPINVSDTGGSRDPTPRSGCLNSGLSKEKTVKRANTVGGLDTPSSGRRIISFGGMDDPSSSAPERRGKFTLPGGRPAFCPGWNDDSSLVVQDAESELDDTRGDSISFSLTVDEHEVISASPGSLPIATRRATTSLPPQFLTSA